MKKEITKENDLRVWYIDRVPAQKTLKIKVDSVKTAKIIIDALSQRDLLDERVTDNSMGLEVFVGGEWEEWTDDDGNNLDDLEF